MTRGPARLRDLTPTGVAGACSPADEGFTLIEVMAAMFLFLMVSTSTAVILMQGLQTIRENQDRVSAANVARSEIEYLRDLARKDPGILPIGQFTGAIPPAVDAKYSTDLNANYLDPVLKTTRYTIKTTSNWVDFASVATGGTSQSACAGESATAAYLRVVVTVSSPDLKEPVSLQTNITQQSKPAAGAAATVGAAAITIVNESSVPVGDVSVTFSDAFHPANNHIPMTTGFDGCLFVPNLEPTASLIVTISRAGYVSSTSTGTVKTLSISADNVTKLGFEYAAAASLKFSDSNPDYLLPAGTQVRWKVKGTGGSTQSNLLTGSVSNLWPGDDVEGWAGNCSDADPQATGAARASYALSAGDTTVAALPVAPVRIVGLKPDQAVTATHAAAGCSDVAGNALSAPMVVPLGKADDKGVVKVGLPYGDWTFTAGTEIIALTAPLAPPAPGTSSELVDVTFLLQVDLKPTPTPTPLPSGSSSTPVTNPTDFPTVGTSPPAVAPTPTDPGAPLTGP
jgi:prepilin-type N-terminal cleavage/methylation domain-containing protein